MALGGWLTGRRKVAGAAVGGAAVAVAAIAAIVLTTGASDAPEAAPTTAAPPVTTTSTTTTTTLPPTTTTSTTSTTTTTTSTTTTSTTTTSTTTSTVPPTLPEQDTDPVAPPPDARAQEPVIALGRIVIPAIGVDMTMYEGIRLTTLDRGPGHWPGSALPGSGGNVVVGGHRTSKHAVFRHVDDLVPGDQIIFVGDDGQQHVYAVNRIEIVDPSAVWIVDPTETPQATLFACHPPGSTRERIIVFSDYVETLTPSG